MGRSGRQENLVVDDPLQQSVGVILYLRSRVLVRNKQEQRLHKDSAYYDNNFRQTNTKIVPAMVTNLGEWLGNQEMNLSYTLLEYFRL